MSPSTRVARIITRLNIGGPAIQAAELTSRLSSRGFETMLRIVGLFVPMMREMVEMHYLQTTPVLLDDTALLTLLGNVRKTTYADGVKKSIEYLHARKYTS